MYKGIGASLGYGVGKIVIISNEVPVYVSRQVDDKEAEWKRFQDALETFISKTQKMADNMRQTVGDKNAEILEGHIIMIEDPYMQDEIKNRIDEGMCAEQALDEVCEMFIMVFSQTEDELTRQRATDISDIKTRMLKLLTGTGDTDISEVPKGTILVAKDLTPSMTAGIIRENVEGIITQTGGKTSHSAILARALEIPAVLSVENITSLVKDGMEAVVDGCEGKVILEPDADTVCEFESKKKKYLEDKELLKKFIGQETVTKDGTKLKLYGNIGKPQDAQKVADNDGEGIGLFRTEFLFMDSNTAPDEETQFEAYKKAAQIMNGKEVIIRTLDVGGDKEIPYLGLEKEENPFLGYRAVRFCLNTEDIYRVQLRAILRASAYGDVKIMVPLVTCVDEIREVKRIVEELKAELDEKNIPYNKNIEVGVMIETPAASEIADLLAKEAAFFSIGTNDLTQYTMAVDRGNAKVAYLYSTYQPAVVRSMKRIVEAASNAGIMVGMCGEAAADPLLTPLLISFGLKEFSVSAVSVLSVRANIAKWTKEEADKAAKDVLAMSTSKEIEEYLRQNVK